MVVNLFLVLFRFFLLQGALPAGAGQIFADATARLLLGSRRTQLSGSADSQMRKGVLFDDINVSGGNSATGIDVVAEVGACHRLKSLRLAEIGVATGHYAARVYVADKHAHLCRNRAAEVAG